VPPLTEMIIPTFPKMRQPNVHIHTFYSDGAANHQELIRIAEKAGLDGIITTDHNIWIDGLDGYYKHEKKKTLLLVGVDHRRRKGIVPFRS